MIGMIITALQSDDHYGVSDTVEVAKGKYQYIGSWRKFKRMVKRTRYAKDSSN